MHETLARTPVQSEVARLVHQALPDSLALCEPWFGHASLALSPDRLHFKVQVINDPSQGLVNLFEMFRIDKHGLHDMIQNDDVHAHFPSFSGKSAFLKSESEASAGLAAFRNCIDNLGIDAKRAAATETVFIETISAIHEKLVPVLVESMPVPEFIARFDRPYSVFFVPRANGGVGGAVKAISAAIAGLVGYLIFEASDAREVQDAFATYVNGVLMTAVGTIAAPARGSESRCLVILKRAV
jgi:hypothetical protein